MLALACLALAPILILWMFVLEPLCMLCGLPAPFHDANDEEMP